MVTRNDFFEDLAVAMDLWAASACKALTQSAAQLNWTDDREAFSRVQVALKNGGAAESDVRQVLGEILRGMCVSMLTVIDGGTSCASKGALRLVDEDSNLLGDGDLHDEYVGYLIETKRLS